MNAKVTAPVLLPRGPEHPGGQLLPAVASAGLPGSTWGAGLSPWDGLSLQSCMSGRRKVPWDFGDLCSEHPRKSLESNYFLPFFPVP